MDKEELIQLFTDFLSEYGKWYDFKEWVEAKGYSSVAELGFDDED